MGSSRCTLTGSCQGWILINLNHLDVLTSQPLGYPENYKYADDNASDSVAAPKSPSSSSPVYCKAQDLAHLDWTIKQSSTIWTLCHYQITEEISIYQSIWDPAEHQIVKSSDLKWLRSATVISSTLSSVPGAFYGSRMSLWWACVHTLSISMIEDSTSLTISWL